LLALALASGEGATVDAPSRDTEGRELPLLAFVLSALADVSYRPRSGATKFPASRTSGADHTDRSGRLHPLSSDDSVTR